MKGIVCKTCGFVSINGTTPGKCPVCTKTEFEEREDALHLPGDKTNFSESEKKHIPNIAIKGACDTAEGCTCVQTVVGEIVHPMMSEHFINNIDFYIEGEFCYRAEMRPDKILPSAVMCMKPKSGKVTVVERCNLHGAWIADRDI